MSGYVARVRAAWAALTGEQRLAAIAALGLIVSMFLPWYTTSADDHSYSAFGVWSFVEASILLVAIGVLGLLFARGERRAFHLPGGDGLVLMAAGGWCMFLDFYRQLDKPNIDASRGTVGVSSSGSRERKFSRRHHSRMKSSHEFQRRAMSGGMSGAYATR